jgi:hypothetical protein
METPPPLWSLLPVRSVEFVMQEPLFAYSLSQVENGWRWRVFDEDGVTVAGGADASRDVAQAAVERLLHVQPVAGEGLAAFT